MRQRACVLACASVDSVDAAASMHYVRCVRPNGLKRPNVVEAGEVLSQLRCSGVLESLKIRKAGFPMRLPFEDLVNRFKW